MAGEFAICSLEACKESTPGISRAARMSSKQSVFSPDLQGGGEKKHAISS